VMMGAGWVINVLVAEWIIRRGKARPKMVRAPGDLLANTPHQ